LQILVGKVIEASREDGSEKLIRETVDVGEEEHRTILSGLAAFTTPDKLEGQLVCVLVNLKARPMGPQKTKSHGMLLCASDDNSVEIIQPPAGALPGTPVFFQGVDTVPAPPNRVQKKKLFEAVAVDLMTGPGCEALYRDMPWQVMVTDEDSGLKVVRNCHSATLSNASIS
jgi:methionine--tRNA ligase beta chain